MQPLQLEALSPAQVAELDHLYRTTRDVRVRTRAQMVLLNAERGMVAAEIAAIVRQDEQTVRRWLTRYRAEGVAGLPDDPRCGVPPKVTAAREASACRSRSGRSSAWPITWPSGPGSASAAPPSGASSPRAASR